MTRTNSVVAIFDQHSQAEDAIRQLQQAGFDMKKLSIVGKGYHTEENVVGYYTTGDRVKYWGANGAFWGGIWGMLFGSAFFFVPGVGPLVVAGSLVAWIVGTLEGAVVVGGLSALGAAFFSIGIPYGYLLQPGSGRNRRRENISCSALPASVHSVTTKTHLNQRFDFGMIPVTWWRRNQGSGVRSQESVPPQAGRLFLPFWQFVVTLLAGHWKERA